MSRIEGVCAPWLAGAIVVCGLLAVGGPAWAQGACAGDSRPDVLVVFDKSGSMDDHGRWPDATRALNQLTAGFDQRMRFGLMLFPSSSGCTTAAQPQVACGPDNGAAIANVLARNGPGGSTPLGAAIDRGRQYLQGVAQRGRRSAIIAITDGGESCDADVARIAAASFAADVPVFLIAFGNGLDADGRRALDRFAAAGGTGSALDAADGDQLLQALEDIAAGLEEEICNGIDDDCDGVVDEGFPGAGDDCPSGRPGLCGPGTRVCVDGAERCRSDLEPSDELCNGLDDDCDGSADEGDPESGADCRVPGTLGPCAFGLTTCVDGLIACATDVVPQDEVCNFTDDDCDGATDEAPLPDVGLPCETGEPGVCGAGSLACVDGDLLCEADGAPVDEACDGLDNDCDGMLDEGVVPGFGEALCATGQTGRCAAGQRVCSLGDWSCAPDGMAVDEVCDAIDDDCDGRIDEGLRNGCGLCAEAVAEQCDGLDQDCDGRLDEDAPCPGDSICIGGACADPCPPSRECSGGAVCHDHPQGPYCVDPCALVDCAAGQACVQGSCVDPCADQACPAGQICRDGDCVAADCAVSGCPADAVCRGGACVPHPCAGVDCPAGEACRDGQCVASCAAVACPLDARCVDGACVSDPCALVQCAAGELCRDGQCVGDPCAGAMCGAGEVCHDGFCVADPCGTSRCPRGERCVARAGAATCAPDWVDSPGCDAVDCAPGELCRVVDGRAACVPAAADVDGGPRPDGGATGFIPGGAADGGPPADSGRAPAEALTTGCACSAGGADGSPGGLALLLVVLGWRRRAGRAR